MRDGMAATAVARPRRYGRPDERHRARRDVRPLSTGTSVVVRLTFLAGSSRLTPSHQPGHARKPCSGRGAHGPGTTTHRATRLAELGREVLRLRRATAILDKCTSAFFAELDLPSRSTTPPVPHTHQSSPMHY